MRKIIPWVGGGIGGLGTSLLFNGSAVVGIVLIIVGGVMILTSPNS